jgi:hypothetical protein
MLSGNEVSRVNTKQLLGTRLVACHAGIMCCPPHPWITIAIATDCPCPVCVSFSH